MNHFQDQVKILNKLNIFNLKKIMDIENHSIIIYKMFKIMIIIIKINNIK